MSGAGGADRVSDRVMRGETPLRVPARSGEALEPTPRTRRVGEALIADLRRQVAEDMVIFDHEIFQPAPRLSRADGPIPEFRRWAAQFYLAGDPRGTNR